MTIILAQEVLVTLRDSSTQQVTQAREELATLRSHFNAKSNGISTTSYMFESAGTVSIL